MTDEEFDAVMYFEEWCRNAKYNTQNNLMVQEAFKIFVDEVYDICLDKIGEKEEEKHFRDLLGKFKKWRLGKELDIAGAKRYPIDRLVYELGYEPNFRRNIRCMLHEDRTASMTLYQQTNTYYCHGCHQGGDVINLLMRARGFTFTEAVKHLT